MAKRPKGAPTDMPWDRAIQSVLSASTDPLHYTEIADRIVSSGLRKSVGATPANTVASYLNASINTKGEQSPYIKVDRGVFRVKDSFAEQPAFADQTSKPEEMVETGALRAFGMFWRRELVAWGGTARLLGKQGLGATTVNFASQVGVYLLHDRERVIYVGRADRRTAGSLFARLKDHTTDRLNGRWDRFSWFGIRSVDDDGSLSDRDIPWSQAVVVETMEALLIESLEPPLNRKRGDNFSVAEYLQVSDPDFERKKKEAVLIDIARAAGLSGST